MLNLISSWALSWHLQAFLHPDHHSEALCMHSVSLARKVKLTICSWNVLKPIFMGPFGGMGACLKRMEWLFFFSSLWLTNVRGKLFWAKTIYKSVLSVYKYSLNIVTAVEDVYLSTSWGMLYVCIGLGRYYSLSATREACPHHSFRQERRKSVI